MKRHNVLSMSWVLNSEAHLLTRQLTWGTVTWNCEFEFSWNQVLKCGKRNNRVKTSLSLDIPAVVYPSEEFYSWDSGAAKLGKKKLKKIFIFPLQDK